MRKKYLATVLACGMLLSLTGCGADNETIAQLNGIEALGSESNQGNEYNISFSDKQEMIYAQVADRTLLDLSKLDACSENELQQTLSYMDKVDSILTGAVKAGEDIHLGIAGADNELGEIGSDEETISHFLTDYILTEFERTPYTWQRAKTIVRGIDSESRSIIVDVTYHTIGHEKDVKPDSSIARGEPNYDTKTKVRFDRYIQILDTEYRRPDDAGLEQMWKDWHNAYGDEKDIIESQNETNFPSARIYKTGIQQTYNGLIDNEADKSGGTMTIRYILVPNYKLGINLGITCEHLYVIDYKLDNDITEGKEVFTEEGYATISDSVNQTLYSYFQCIDESDFHGLYKLTKNFGKIDKFYEDMSQTMYNKHNNFTVSLFEVQGTHISCGVTISSKVRARGSLMTYPNYTDRYYVELDLIGDVLKVSNLTLLSRTLEGEPAIKTGDADTTGFMAGFEIDNDDRLAIEDLICRFGVLQLKGDTASDDFGDVVDLSMTVSNLAELKQHMQSIKGEKKVVWLQNYQQGSSNYASVKCKENVQDGDSVIEATVTYDFIHKGGKWYVYAYNINQQIRLNTSQLSTTGSLCLLSTEKVESYNSQVKGTQSNADETVVSDISVSYEHDAYTPVRKTPTKEEKEDIKEIVKQIFTGDIVGLKDAWATSTELNNIITYDQAVEVCESFAEDGDIRTALYAYLATAAVFKINADANYYADKEEEFNKDKAAVQALYDEFTSSDIYSLVRTNDNFAKANNAVKQILDKTDFE